MAAPPESGAAACIRSLIAEGALSAADAARAEAAARGSESAVAACVRLGLIPAGAAAGAAAAALGLPFHDEAAAAALGPPPAGNGSLAAFVAAHALVLTEEPGGGLLAALADPYDEPLRRAVALAAAGPVRFAVTTPEGVAAWRARALAGGRPKPAPATETEPAPGGAAVEALEALLETAARLGASDLHLEPAGAGGRARARVGGAMRVVGALDAATYPAALARAKVLARLDVAERRLPQDGRARLALAGRTLDLRLSTAPAIGGETLAIRLLDPAAAPGRLEALGLPAEYEAAVAAAARAPHGLFLLTGPTGAGKTTTLHAALSGLNTEARKIMTAEDPVEYEIPGVVQMQVRPEIGFDFARAQRAMLRHNPDVMMVGEIRDGESAATAIQAALTGHLVLSTVHANSAAGAAIRLLDLGVEPFLVSAAVIGAGAQRLARRLCEACAEPDAPDPAALARIGAPEGGRWRRAPGCAACGGTGTKGRVPVAEAFLASRAFAEAVRGPAPSEAALAELTGATPLSRAALDLAARGAISLEEALRVAPPARS
ncbi:MAG: GspE/PulE family protein [Pikeienuella sp.]|uniref:GspE/PulE family protein n=1 Tax=Pikeienuella sp. TaxID=2831957 RepID=UPI00391960D2